MKDILKKQLNTLFKKGKESLSNQWQSVEIPSHNPIVEVQNLFFTVDSIKDLVEDFNPDLPWAEDHFLERINGEPINPGVQYQNWPYYRDINNDDLFRSSGKFSHNYMERYWCKGFKGIRFNYGDLNDIIQRLIENKYTRQAFLAVWHPEDQSNHGERVPCTIGYWFNMQDGKLCITYLIRSCDAIRHFRNDMYMTYRLLDHVASIINVPTGSISTWIGSFHCFKSDLYTLRKLI